MAPIRTSYLICTTPRSGSNFLCEVLQSFGVAGCPHEYFWNPPFWHEQWGVSDFPSYFERILQEGRTPNGVFGMKIMWYHLEEVLPKLALIFHDEEAPLPQRLETAFPNLRYIWLTRRDKVRQAVSFHRALQTKVWKSTDVPQSPPVTPTFDFDAIAGLLDLVEGEDRSWQEYFEGNGIVPLTITYEEMADALEETVRRILRFLDVPVPEDLSFPQTQHRKQADALSDEWVERYRALERPQQESAGT